MTLRVALVEDHQVFADALTTMLAQEDIQVVGVAPSEAEALQLVAATRPDLVIVDVTLDEGHDGIAATEALVREHEQLPILILTMHDDADTVTRALAAGARGYVPKHCGRNTLVTAIVAVSQGSAYLHPSITGPFLERIGPLAAEAASEHRLTAHELRVLRAVALGASTKTVAADLGVSPETVKSHLRRVYEKLGVDDRVQAVATAIRRGIIE
ncbi:MAG: response regulator transcription factor [Actinobacteria bacterium]|nr:response regulator transcription factor [Actinomycetota bacterium]